MELTNKFIFSVLISTLFFTEALCLSRKLIGHEQIVHAGKKFSLPDEPVIQRNGEEQKGGEELQAGKKFSLPDDQVIQRSGDEQKGGEELQAGKKFSLPDEPIIQRSGEEQKGGEELHAGKKFSLPVMQRTGEEQKGGEELHAGKKFGIGINIGIHGPLTIDSICAKTDYAPLCVNSLRAKVHGPVDPLALLRAEIEATGEKVKTAQAHVAQLELKPDLSRDSLRICKENYGFAIDSLEKAKLAIESHDLGSINSELSAVTTYASTCDDTFAESPGETSPLAAEDEEVSHLGSNCLAITDLINWG